MVIFLSQDILNGGLLKRVLIEHNVCTDQIILNLNTKYQTAMSRYGSAQLKSFRVRTLQVYCTSLKMSTGVESRTRNILLAT